MNNKKVKRVMVDMSATLIHQGHTRLLQRASQHGSVVVGLTTDDEVLRRKGYQPELTFESRKEILLAIAAVDEVVPTPWLITEEVLNHYKIDLLIHGDDNLNRIPQERLLLLPRTEGVSSNEIRLNTLRSMIQIHNQKLMLTPGPAALLHQSLQYVKPIFGQGDSEYQEMKNQVFKWLRTLSGQDKILAIEGSTAFALNLALAHFVSGKVLLVGNESYCEKIKKCLANETNLTHCPQNKLDQVDSKYEWILCPYTDIDFASRVDLPRLRELADKLGATILLDGTGSIGLEDHHELADIVVFNSSMGLFGLTGAAFVAYKDKLEIFNSEKLISIKENQQTGLMSDPVHAIASLYGVIDIHDRLKLRVCNSKSYVLDRWSDFIDEKHSQPSLCTYLDGQVYTNDDLVVLYQPDNGLDGSVICHLGEVHHDFLDIGQRISIA